MIKFKISSLYLCFLDTSGNQYYIEIQNPSSKKPQH